jgi:hypothetical protein
MSLPKIKVFELQVWIDLEYYKDLVSRSNKELLEDIRRESKTVRMIEEMCMDSTMQYAA